MRLFLFVLGVVLVLLFLVVIYCLLRVSAEEDRWLEKRLTPLEKEKE